MAPRTLLSCAIPIILLPHDAPHSVTTTAPPTDLTALLSHSPAEDSVTLTLSDLSTRLLLLRYVLTAAEYAPLRESESLLIDFAAFPAHLCDLLQRVSNDDDYIATLRLPRTLDNGEQQAVPPNDDVAVLRVVQTSAVKSIAHINLILRPASHEELVAAVAGRAREAEIADARAKHLQRVLEEERSRTAADTSRRNEREANLQLMVERLESEMAHGETVATRVSQLEEENRTLSTQLQATQTQLGEAHDTIAQGESLRDEMGRMSTEADRTHEEVAQLEEARRRLTVERDDCKREFERVTEQRNEATSEIGRGNVIIEKLQGELNNQRARGKVKTAVITRQEEAVRRLETKNSELERDVRRTRDRAALLQVEKEGLDGRLASSLQKLEENAAVLASDQQVISYLNRELNERAIGEVRDSGGGRPSNRSLSQARRRPRSGTSPSPDIGVT